MPPQDIQQRGDGRQAPKLPGWCLGEWGRAKTSCPSQPTDGRNFNQEIYYACWRLNIDFKVWCMLSILYSRSVHLSPAFINKHGIQVKKKTTDFYVWITQFSNLLQIFTVDEQIKWLQPRFINNQIKTNVLKWIFKWSSHVMLPINGD